MERLDDFDKDEWRDKTRHLWPKGYTDDDFERDWAEFQDDKRRRGLQ